MSASIAFAVIALASVIWDQASGSETVTTVTIGAPVDGESVHYPEFKDGLVRVSELDPDLYGVRLRKVKPTLRRFLREGESVDILPDTIAFNVTCVPGSKHLVHMDDSYKGLWSALTTEGATYLYVQIMIAVEEICGPPQEEKTYDVRDATRKGPRTWLARR